MRDRKRLTLLFQTVEMKLDGFMNQPHDFVPRFSRGDAAGQIRHVSAPAFRALFDNNHVFHVSHLLLETGLLEDITRRARRHVDARLTCNRDNTDFSRVPELSMTAFHANLLPAVGFYPLYQLCDLHEPGPAITAAGK